MNKKRLNKEERLFAAYTVSTIQFIALSLNCLFSHLALQIESDVDLSSIEGDTRVMAQFKRTIESHIEGALLDRDEVATLVSNTSSCNHFVLVGGNWAIV
jgi:hypothetical protein